MTEVVPAKASQIDMERAAQKAVDLAQFYERVMKAGVDYSILPGTSKPSLRKEGAELLAAAFDFRPVSQVISSKEITDPNNPYYEYVVKCTLYNRWNEVIGDAMGSANSREIQFSFKWVDASEVSKDTKTYGERIANGKRQVRVALEPWEVFGLQNKVLKMADKRAFVAAVLRVTGASRIFTQDLEDEEHTEQQKNAEPSTPAQQSYIRSLMRKDPGLDKSVSIFLSSKGAKSIEDLSKQDASELINMLQG